MLTNKGWKMKVKINFKLVFLLAMLLIIYGACKRNVLEEPSPLGPSSLSTLLNVTASPNVLTAGTTRQASTITASLKKFDTVPLENKTIIFEICDDRGNIINVGYFEGNKSTETKVTDANGIATLRYYGPLASEVVGSTAVYIWASVASEGSESISQSTPVYIMADITELTLGISASPNVLYAGTARGTSIITSALKTASRIALANQTIYFEICDADGNKINTGYFEGNESVSTKITNASGNATVTYYGPLNTELSANTAVYIRATVALQGNTSISDNAPINIIRDFIETRLNIFANPTVLNAGVARGTSTITATLKNLVNGTPLANWNIRFEICNVDGNRIYVGYFDSNEQVVIKITDANGTATVTYHGPLAKELPATATYIIVYIRVTAWLGNVSVSEVTPIYIYKI
jgi:hypothetical protein